MYCNIYPKLKTLLLNLDIGGEKMENKVDHKLPLSQLIPLGLQHVLAMYAGAVAVPLIVGAAVGMTPVQLAHLVSADLFTCGIATLIQSLGVKEFMGIKLPVVLGCTFASVGPMCAIGKQSGITAVYGAIICSGIFVILIAPFFGKILRFFPTLVSGTIITIIGLTLIPVGIKNAAGGEGAPGFGNPINLLLALFVMVIILFINKYFKGFMQAVAVLIGLIIGSVVASFMGMVNVNELFTAKWISIVTPFSFGFPKFEIGAIVTMCIVVIVVMIESTGVFIAIGEVCEKDITEKDIVKGLRTEGFANILGGIFNSFPYSTFSQNVGLVALTKVSSRYVVVAAGVILVLLGIVPKFAALATIVPTCVFGGAMIIMFSMVSVSGIRMLQQVDFNKNTNLLIVACSIGIGLGTSVVPGLFTKTPEIIQMTLGHGGIVSGSITAVLLNLALNFDEIKNYNKNSNKETPQNIA